MSYSELTVNSPSRIKRWSHGARFAKALAVGRVEPGDIIADYGAGDGLLLQKAMEVGRPAEMWAFEPMLADQARQRLGDSARVVERASDLPDAHFDKVFCMEVLEHLRPDIRDDALRNIRRILKPEGVAIVTVPIEVGLSSLFKNVVRIAMGKPHDGTRASSIFWSAVGRPGRIPRRDGGSNYISSHLGFDYRQVPDILRAAGFRLEAHSFSPAPLLGPMLNSQVSYRVRSAGHAGR